MYIGQNLVHGKVLVQTHSFLFLMGLPWWLSGASLYTAGDTGDPDSVPGLGRSPGGGNGNLLQCSCLKNPMDRGAWWARVHGVAESNMTERLRLSSDKDIEVPRSSEPPRAPSVQNPQTCVQVSLTQSLRVKVGTHICVTEDVLGLNCHDWMCVCVVFPRRSWESLTSQFPLGREEISLPNCPEDHRPP